MPRSAREVCSPYVLCTTQNVGVQSRSSLENGIPEVCAGYIPIKTISSNLCVDQSTARKTLRLFDSTGTVDKKARKKMRLVAIQQSEELRARYLAEVALHDPNMLVFVDETGSNRKDAMRRFGYSLRGQHCIAKKLLVCGQRVSAITALSSERVLDVMFVNGSVNGETFSQFIELNLLPHLLPFNGSNPNSVVVLDNASVHYHERVRDLISSVGALVVYLPPYSPDLNPIEMFSAAKSFLKAKKLLQHQGTSNTFC